MTATPELNKALAAFQAELPRITENATVDMGNFTNSYAQLDVVAQIVLPLLGKHGLAYIACPTILEDGQRVLAYALVHGSGEERGGHYPLPDKATAQQMGGAITYARRYCLLSVTGVHPGGEDDDGAEANQAPAPERPAQRPASKVVLDQFKRIGVTDRGIQYGYIAALTGHAVTRFADLTDGEQEILLDALRKCPNQAALDQLSKQEAST